MFSKYGNMFLIPVSSFLFSMGFFSLSFSFPLSAEHLRYNTFLIGMMGLAVGIPFPLLALLMLRMGSLSLLRLIRYSIVGMVPITLLFVYLNSWTFVPLLTFANVSAATFFVAAEMCIGLSNTENLAERYSASWGIPNLIAPIVAGLVLQNYGFDTLFVFAGLFFLFAVLFLPVNDELERETYRKSKPEWSMLLVLPMLFSGISAGFFYFVMIPYIRSLGISYLVIGIVASIPPLASALVFVILNRIRSESWNRYASIAAALLAFPLLLYFSQWLLVLSLIFALSGCGMAISFSKILSYISSTSSSSQGILYYETFFGIGYIVGSLTGGFLLENIGFAAVIPIFIPALAYALYMLLKHSSRNVSAVPL